MLKRRKKSYIVIKNIHGNKSERITTFGSLYNSHAPSGAKYRKQSERSEASGSRFDATNRGLFLEIPS